CGSAPPPPRERRPCPAATAPGTPAGARSSDFAGLGGVEVGPAVFPGYPPHPLFGVVPGGVPVWAVNPGGPHEFLQVSPSPGAPAETPPPGAVDPLPRGLFYRVEKLQILGLYPLEKTCNNPAPPPLTKLP